jgi:pimeloyl-ACP methyl ester carboxylesterase
MGLKIGRGTEPVLKMTISNYRSVGLPKPQIYSLMHIKISTRLKLKFWPLLKPFNMSILTEKSGPPAWKQLPTWYQVSENDRSIPPELEHSFAKQTNATTISLPASHLSFLSHPQEVAQLILRTHPKNR